MQRFTEEDARAALAAGRPEEVLAHWSGVRDDLLVGELLLFAVALFRQGRFDDAGEAARRCLNLNVGHPVALQLISQIEAQGRTTSSVRRAWEPGETVLDSFEVVRVLGRGGFGEVYHVTSKASGNAFAVKRALVGNEARSDVMREVRRWMSLPEHPNLVTCRFVRLADDEVVIFADLVEGGAIRSSERYSLQDVVHIGVQMARGLAVLHRAGVVHQDVKPGNALASRAGLVRITDFGLARSRAMSDSTLASVVGMTPAYASPEQASRQPLDSSTDVWSFGVSLLELVVGGVSWQSGAAAPAVLARERSRRGPHELDEVIEACLARDPKSRPTMESVAGRLQRLWSELAQKPYPHRRVDERGRNDDLEPEGDYYLSDEVQWRSAASWNRYVETAFGIRVDIKNDRLPGYRAQVASEIEAFDSLLDALESSGQGDVVAEMMLDRASLVASIGDRDSAFESLDRAIELARTARVRGRALAQHATLALKSGARETPDLLAAFDRAIELLAPLGDSDAAFLHEKARAYANRAVVASRMGAFREEDLKASIAAREQLVERYGGWRWRVRLSRAHAISAATLLARKRAGDAVRAAEKALDAIRGCPEEADVLAARANALHILGRARSAVDGGSPDYAPHYDSIVDAYVAALERGSRPPLITEAAHAFLAAADAIKERRVELVGRATELFRSLVEGDGLEDHLPDLAHCTRRLAACLAEVGRHHEAVEHYVVAERMYGRLPELVVELAETLHNHGNSLSALGMPEVALERYERAVEILVGEEGRGAEERRTYEGTLARKLLQAGEVTRAEEIASRLIEQGESGRALVDALQVRAAIAKRRGDDRSARELAMRIAALEGGDERAPSYAVQRASRLESEGDLDGAFALAESVLRSEQETVLGARARAVQARVHERRGDNMAARREAQRAFKLLSAGHDVRQPEREALLEVVEQLARLDVAAGKRARARTIVRETINVLETARVAGEQVEELLARAHHLTSQLAADDEDWVAATEGTLGRALALAASGDIGAAHDAFVTAREQAKAAWEASVAVATGRLTIKVWREHARVCATVDPAFGARLFESVLNVIDASAKMWRTDIWSVERVATRRARADSLNEELDFEANLEELGASDDELALEERAILLFRAALRATASTREPLLERAIDAVQEVLGATGAPEHADMLAKLLCKRASRADLERAVEIYSMLDAELPRRAFGERLAGSLVELALAQVASRDVVAVQTIARALEIAQREQATRPSPTLEELLARARTTRALVDRRFAT